MSEFVGPAIEVGKCIAEPIKRQFNYLCCFSNNIQNLRDEAKKLNDAKDGVEGQVDAARRNVQVILPQVVTWLVDVNKIQEDYVSGIEPEIGNVESNCLAIKSRFSLSRKATKMAADMKVLQDNSKFGQICHPAPPTATSLIPPGQTYELESRKHFEEEMMATLREKKVSMMGICGMGGLGKTVMAKKIMSRAREEGLFDEIVMVVVSQPVDMMRIQQEMAELLGLRLEDKCVSARAHLLRARLTNAKSILIILDDLWKTLNLEDLGIPDQRELKACTILLTSRSRDVFSAMNVEKTFQMKILEDAEAWSLFKEKVGACADDPNLFPLAQEIVRECKGLPIALVTVGVALKDKANFVWEDAVHELRSCNPQDIPDFLAQVYNPLKLSYDLLESEHARSIFLMCCLFPEDHSICISDLSFYAWGLDMFEGIRSLQAAENKVQTLVEMLKNRSLLLDGYNDVFTRMHDVVRDVGIFIAAKKGLIDPNISWKSLTREENNYSIDCTWISLFSADKITLSGWSASPNLRFLLLEANELPLSDNFFESARELSVLSITCYLFRSLPHTIQLQKNLRTLILKRCNAMVDISVVGELVSLEILYCESCRSIKELPIEIGRLNQLKLLHIEDCENLKKIAAGVISRLIRLEELTIFDSFSEWERGASEGKNAALCELNSLSKLTTLRIEIEDASLAAEEIHVLSNLVQFDVRIGTPDYRERTHERHMDLRLEGEVVIGDWIHQLLKKTECLDLEGESSGKLVPLLPELQSLKQLELRNLKMTRLVGVRSSSTAAIFPLLEDLRLFHIDNLEEITLGNDCLLRLKTLLILSCSMLEQVALWNEEENIQSITFTKLKSLVLLDLPRLASFCRGVQNIKFPQLTSMNIQECPNMKSLVSSGAMKHDDDSLHIFWKSKAAFGSRLKALTINDISSVISRLWCAQISMDFFTGLVELTVSKCGNINSLFSPTVANNLVNLKRIVIESCWMLEQVVLWNEEENEQSSCNHRSVTFPKLERIEANNLPRLASFCKGIQSMEFPLLTQMDIVECPNLKSLVSTMENDFKKCSDDDSLHLFCKTDETAFGRMKILRIKGISSVISGLWCDQFSMDIFTGLVDLTVSNCDNIKSLFSPLAAGNLVNLRELSIKSCREMVKVLEDRVNEVGGSPFINLKVLTLEELPMLKGFCDWRYAFDFPSLTKVYISKCPLLERFPISSVSFKNLESIEIMSCSMLEQVMLWNDERNGEDINGKSSRNHLRIILPKLKKLKLRDLPRLTSFGKGIQHIEFPVLTRMEIVDCPNSKSLVSSTENGKRCSGAIDDDNSLHLFCNSQAALGRLDQLVIGGYECIYRSESLWCDQIPIDFFTRLVHLNVRNYGNIKSMFSASIAGNLVNLRKLRIEGCGEMVKVIEDEEALESSPFTKLEVLLLNNLPKLKTFCDWRCALHLPSLSYVNISKCPEMERFSFGSLTTPNFNYISINGEAISKYTKDLNDALSGEYSFHLGILFGSDDHSQ